MVYCDGNCEETCSGSSVCPAMLAEQEGEPVIYDYGDDK